MRHATLSVPLLLYGVYSRSTALIGNYNTSTVHVWSITRLRYNFTYVHSRTIGSRKCAEYGQRSPPNQNHRRCNRKCLTLSDTLSQCAESTYRVRAYPLNTCHQHQVLVKLTSIGERTYSAESTSSPTMKRMCFEA